jgi:hypothetical protein
MSRRAPGPAGNGGNGEYAKLENRLVLLAWLNSLFGYKSNRELLAGIKDAGEGFDSYGRSHVHEWLVGRGDKVRIPAEVLGRYDENIRAHLNAINARRPQPIKLRYFQYLSVLYAEVYIDWYFNHPAELLVALNGFVQQRNARRAPGEPQDPPYAGKDLTKLAFWMATGSGKTLVMHFNYRQFLHYNKHPLDNILLITPNEGLTDQHIKEMEASGLPCARFNIEESGLWSGGKNVVRVIEITKLVEEKRGAGVSVDVESFQGNNLIFVDEGHKGSGGEAWRKFRDRLGETGFTFEYSATFGQALTAARNDELTAEYGKAIAFDYSYKYFHGNGFGKDFHILNLREETREEDTETLLLGNLLSFYEQQRCFAEQADALRPYNLEPPLWVFVGSSVNAVYRESGKARSDVLTVVRFLHHFLENKRAWSVRTIKKLIEGKSGLRNPEGGDVFAEGFEYLRGAGQSPDAIYRDTLSTVFHAPAGGGLHMCDIKGSAGELGLKAGGAESYFGLIYIGDTASFKKLAEEDDSGITLEDDSISASLFAGINRADATINVLIGAKKFMEGWNSWRVSNMGLLNIGRTEGSEIIQLFGRGVRLRGLGFGLKRSSALDGSHPEHVRLLETLNIFAVRADYMAQFREYLEREGVETLGQVVLPLTIRSSEEFLHRNLIVPRVPPDRDFAQECEIVLAPHAAAKVSVDMSLKVESMRSGAVGLKTETMHAGREVVIPAGNLDLVDWGRVYLDIIEYKEQKGLSNLVIRPQVLRDILAADEPRLYKLVADEAVAVPKSFGEAALLAEAILTILRKYVEKFYYVSKERWDSENMVYAILDRTDSNFRDYTLRIDRTDRELIAAIQKLIAEGDRVYTQETSELPNIHFDRHLYQPLLVERGEKVRSDPPGLKGSERRFVESLREFVRREATDALAKKEVFLLRNLSRGRGVGFFENEGFYPDFILWIREGDRQRILFVEPHGMLREKTYWNDDKAQLHLRLRQLSEAWATRTGTTHVMLDSFIVSATPYDDLRDYYPPGNWSKERFADAHILFIEDLHSPDVLARLFIDDAPLSSSFAEP